MRKVIYIFAITATLLLMSCSTDLTSTNKTGNGSFNELVDMVRPLHGSPYYKNYAEESIRWLPKIKEIKTSAFQKTVDFEGVVFPTESTVEGMEVESPLEILNLCYSHPGLFAEMVCEIGSTGEFNKAEIAVVGYSGDVPRVFVGANLPNWTLIRNGKTEYMYYSIPQGARGLLRIMADISIYSADRYKNLTKFVLMQKENPVVQELQRQQKQEEREYNNMYRSRQE